MAEIPLTEHALPGTLQEIARLAGTEIAVVVARKFGGTRLYFPRKLKPGHELTKEIGRRAALILCRHWGGEKVDIPAARTYLRWYDARQLRTVNHLSNFAIARELKISERQVRTLLEGFDPQTGETEHVDHGEVHDCPVCGHRRRNRRAHDDRQLTLF